MRLAPKNTTLDRMTAETRGLSQVMGPLSNEKVEQIQNKKNPMDTRYMFLFGMGIRKDTKKRVGEHA